jgi:hypothetical protein
LAPPEFKGIALDIELELDHLARLRAGIDRVNRLLDATPELADVFYESLGLKLHNFYTRCERVFRIVASELNGALPGEYDWHRRLLERMAVAHESRPALISGQTASGLEKYLAFRHVVRNIYGYELEAERVTELVADHEVVWRRFEAEARAFCAWLRELAEELE